MIELVSKANFTYKGIHYLDLMARNKQKGGTVSDLTVKSNSDRTLVSFKTNYLEGLTITTEELEYKNNLLISWALITNEEKHTIFSRDMFNQYTKNR